MMAKRSRTRTKRVVDRAADDIDFVRSGPSPDDRSQAVRRALKLRWAQQRRCLDLANHEH